MTTYQEFLTMILEEMKRFEPRIQLRVGGYAYRLAEALAKRFFEQEEELRQRLEALAERHAIVLDNLLDD